MGFILDVQIHSCLYFSETDNHVSSLDGGPQPEKRAKPKQEGAPRSVPTI